MSGILLVDRRGNRPDVDSAGRPTHLTWSLTPFTGSGSFTAGTFSLATGVGIVDIKYRDNGGHVPPHATSLGEATVLFRGSIFTPGTTNPFTNVVLQTKHSRPQPF